MRKLTLSLLLLAVGSAPALAESPAPALYGRLTVNQTHIVFSYAGDLWAVGRGGGEARRLTTHPAEESFPVFSPDGATLAFSRQAGGNWDVYVMPAAGGEARRLTYHPRNDFASGWTPDGKRLLFGSNRTGIPRLYAMAADGIFPDELPLPVAFNGSYAPDGARLAYEPKVGIGEWRYYRGGGQGQIWLTDLTSGAVERLPQGNYNDDFPMWVGRRIYFISDRTGIYNLYAYDLSTKQAKQLTSYTGHGIRWVSAGAGAIAFVRAGRIHLHDMASGQTRVVDVITRPDTAELQPRQVNAARTIEHALLSASGDRVIFGARGEAIVLDPATGEARNLTGTPGVAERYPALSPDGRWLAYFSDESGEYELHVRPVDGGQAKKMAIEARPSFYRELTWSPDGRRLAFTDKRLALWCADVQSGKAWRVDTSTYSYQQEWFPAWSPDGRWLTYSKHLRNRARTVFIYDVDGKAIKQITDGRTHAEQPCFDANGKYLYFASSDTAGLSEYGWGVLNGVFARPLVARRLHAIVLRDGAPSPLLPNGQPDPEARAAEPDKEVRIDFEGIGRRVVDLPTPMRDFGQLTPGRPGVLYAQVREWPASPSFGNGPTPVLYMFDLTKSPKFEKVAERADGLEVSRDGRRLLYLRGQVWYLVSTEAAPKPDEGRLDLGKMQVTVDPKAEWRQMYREAWRIMRDWFYDPNHHGQDLAALERHFAEYLPAVTRRADLNALLNRMLGHVSVSHLGVGDGDLPPPAGPPSRVGLLGADYEIANDRYRFRHVYRAASYASPTGSVGAPLDRPGLSVRDGEYLLAVDGKPLDATQNVYAAFEGKAGQAVKITVGPTPEGQNARTLTVYPVPNDADLRLANWAEDNRRRVEEASGGKLGYLYVGSYGEGILDFVRGLTGYADRPGVIIDQRFNGGGTTPDYLIEWLRRRPLYYYTFREGDDIATPVNPGPPAKVLLLNDVNFSAAETFAFMFKLGKVGPIVGARTGGGGIGPYVFTPRLIDGGRIQLPNRAAFNPDGTSWGIENVGILPDHEVEIMPADFRAGRDPQLEKAIQVGLEEVKKNQPAPVRKPKYPVHP